MKTKMKAAARKDHRGTVSWYNMDYLLLNGFLLPERAHSALCDLIALRRFHDVDSAIREGIQILLEENTPILIRNDRKWIRQLGRMGKMFRDPAREKPDPAGAENLRFLNEMYKAMAKAENET